jgi:hypothetical protein
MLEFMGGKTLFSRPIAVAAMIALATTIAAAQAHEHHHPAPDDDASASSVNAMSGPIVQTAHLKLTAMRTPNAHDSARAAEVLHDMREGIEPYRDYRKALDDGYRIFLPNVPMKVYHFTNYRRAMAEGRAFDAKRPSSLLYEKQPDGGYTLVGVMYIAKRDATPDELHARIPLSMAQWHAHVNICVPKMRERDRWRETADGKPKFGPAGTISTKAQCAREKGRFFPQMFGWMVHVGLEEGFDGR